MKSRKTIGDTIFDFVRAQITQNNFHNFIIINKIFYNRNIISLKFNKPEPKILKVIIQSQ